MKAEDNESHSDRDSDSDSDSDSNSDSDSENACFEWICNTLNARRRIQNRIGYKY